MFVSIARAAAVTLTLAAPAAALAQGYTLRTYTSEDSLLRLGQVELATGKTLDLSVGIGSAAFRHRGDPANVVWTVGDRGPNIACGDLSAAERAQLCRANANGRVYPVPGYAPSIYKIVLLDDGTFRVGDVITVKDSAGVPISGLTNPLKTATTEVPLDAKGNILKQHPANLDLEGLVRLADGSFWLGEENAPSIVHVGADGRVLARYVPKGTEGEFAGAGYPVIGHLPAILAKRQSNRGIESMAMSPDERFLYTIVQNPLANPNADAYRRAVNTRLFKIDRASLALVGEYVYTLSNPRSFRLDPSDNQSAPRISEMTAIDENRLIVLERTDGTTHLYEVDLAAATNILGTRWDDAATSPSLEQTNLVDGPIRPMSKKLVFDSANHPEIPGKIEGLAVMRDGSLLLVNDDDFGITGGTTKIIVLQGFGLPGN